MPIHSDPTKMEEGELIYALDIGTRSVIGMLACFRHGFRLAGRLLMELLP